ncbi:MAG: type II toxin-antitoxin system PemK/MazF family toxin [Bryobacteraceae bacterium]
MSEPGLRRGDIVICAFSGDYGKPRPAVVVQSNLFNRTHETIMLCPISSELTGLALFRVPLLKAGSTGLRKDSEVMVDKMTASTRSRIRQRVGQLSAPQMNLVDTALQIWLDLPAEA